MRSTYFFVGVVDVVVNGKRKWNSYKEAERAAKKFIQNTFGDDHA